jgi:predicted AlkP superfamily phosphohydrolase/phosphomutase
MERVATIRRVASRALVIGLDCAPPELVFERWRDELPTIRSLMERGRYGVLQAATRPSPSRPGPA